jgi:hypothetical protein
MTIMRSAGPALAAVLVLGLTACAEGTGGPGAQPSPTTTAQLPDDPAALVLRVEHTGGFMTPDSLAARLPLVSVYADGRVISEGPVAAIYPGFAWPNVQVRQLAPEQVQELVDRALDAGVADTADLGTPPLADAASTRFTVVTAGETFVREAYALAEAVGVDGLTDEQEAARAELSALLGELTGVGQPGDGSPQSYEPVAVAAVVRPWTPLEDDVDDGIDMDLGAPPVRWPGPPLPGEPLGPLPDLTCAVAEGEEAAALRTAAGEANVLTPWTTSDGATWSVTFRPLLPDETGCADLGD